ncbi:MAG: lyase family protein, partial [Halobacteriales archaeon]|nr:lyase family protein [Halobacteriales archaeon]
MPDPLDAVSPLDGRYAGRTAPLRAYASEAALMRARVHVEVEYLIALSDLEATPLELDETDRSTCRALYEEFEAEDAQLVKQIETSGTADYAATNHDVKAIEYFIRERLPADLDRVHPWIHFGLTSEDVNNLAYRLLIGPAVEEVLRPRLVTTRTAIADLARDHRAAVMLARTHGQPATPTTFGKEMAVFVGRLDRATDRIEAADAALA